MDSYLRIAEAVLRKARRPLAPRAIIDVAYREGLVPEHLYGRTQHKTLQARLSEDILEMKEQSTFFRTAPGKFFLREYLTDDTLPEEYRDPVTARPRIRELIRGPALAVDFYALRKIGRVNQLLECDEVFRFLHSNHYYDDPKRPKKNSVFFWSFVSVMRDSQVLSYRIGRYRENRDHFLHKRTIGFTNLVHANDLTLFTMKDLGITSSGVKAAKLDLDIPQVGRLDEASAHEASLSFFIWSQKQHCNELISFVRYFCPKWFEPTRRRLAINDLQWIDLSKINNIDDFDPWSALVIENGKQHLRENIRKDEEADY